MPSMQSLDIRKRSATTTAPPKVRQAGADPVAKLIDIAKCIGCKACEVACMQWNDLRNDIGTNVGVYDNPIDLTNQSCCSRRSRASMAGATRSSPRATVTPVPPRSLPRPCKARNPSFFEQLIRQS